MATNTPNLNLNVPDYGDQNWDVPINQNWSILDTAIALKANDSDVVKLTGNQTINGVKTFTNRLGSKALEFAGMSSTANNGGYIDFHYNNSTSDFTSRIIEDAPGRLNFEANSVVAPTPATADSSTQIATTANVDAKITAQAVKLTGDQTLGTGMKSFTDLVEFKNGGRVWSTANNAERDSRYNCKFYQYGLADSVLPSNNVFGGFHCFDKNNFEFGTAYSNIGTDGTVGTCLWVHTPNGTPKAMGIYQNASGVTWTSAPTPATSDNSTKIATTAFVKNQGYVGTANLATCHVVVETYVNGASWYRVYDDGWVEQGGIYTGTGTNNPAVSLLKTMANTNYYANCVNVNFSSTNNYLGHGIKSRQTTTLTLEASYNPSMNMMWIVCGQGA